MTPAQIQVLDEALLRVMEQEDSRFGLTAEALALMVQRFGQRVDEYTVARRMRYLADPQVGFVRVVEIRGSEFHTNVQSWQITARGANHIAGGE